MHVHLGLGINALAKLVVRRQRLALILRRASSKQVRDASTSRDIKGSHEGSQRDGRRTAAVSSCTAHAYDFSISGSLYFSFAFFWVRRCSMNLSALRRKRRTHEWVNYFCAALRTAHRHWLKWGTHLRSRCSFSRAFSADPSTLRKGSTSVCAQQHVRITFTTLTKGCECRRLR